MEQQHFSNSHRSHTELGDALRLGLWGIATGTIFPGLNKPFFVLEENPFETGFKPDENASPEQQERELLMKEISALSFALTIPCCIWIRIRNQQRLWS